MISYSLTVDSLSRSKDCLFAHIGRSSGHIDEALASGFGYRSRAALLAALDAILTLDVVFDPDAFVSRYISFGHADEDVRAASIRAVCHGFENWVDADIVDGSPEDVKTAIDAMAVQHARRKLAALNDNLISILVRRQVVISDNGLPTDTSTNRVVFPPSAYMTDDDTLGKLGVAYGIWEAECLWAFLPDIVQRASELFRSDTEKVPSRISKYGIACNSASGVMTCISQAADDPRGFGELDALQTGLYLARKLKEHESGDSDERESRRQALVAIAARRFPALVYGVVLREIYDGDSIIPSTNTKILMSAKGWSHHIRPGNSLRFVRSRQTVVSADRRTAA